MQQSSREGDHRRPGAVARAVVAFSRCIGGRRDALSPGAINEGRESYFPSRSAARRRRVLAVLFTLFTDRRANPDRYLSARERALY